MTPTIIDAIRDENLFLPYLAPDGDLSSWSRWLTALRVLYGLPLAADEHAVVKANTGRDPALLPADGFPETLVLAGRRSGKSKVIALVAAYEALFSDALSKISPGELAVTAVVSPTKNQSRIVHSYIRSVFDSTPLLANEVVEERKESFKLRNGVEISIIVSDPKACRGFSLTSCVIDEISMHGLSEESKVRSDDELIRAIRPSLSSTNGRLLCIGTPFRAAGYSYRTYQRAFGNDKCDVLCWNSPSTEMNLTLNPAVVARAMEEDATSARCEYVVERGAFREDIDDFVSRSVIESLVVPGRTELAPRKDVDYKCFVDCSGGMVDDAAIAVAHREHGKIVIDCLRRYPAPHRPQAIVERMVVDVIKRYGCDSEVVGDWYSAQWVRSEFESHGIKYHRASQSVWKEGAVAAHREGVDKSRLYLELLPYLHSGQVELPDDAVLVSQLASLQRRARKGRDDVDHPPNAHDDLANAVAGAVYCAAQRTLIAGAVDPRRPSVLTNGRRDADAAEFWAGFRDRQAEFIREQREARERYNGPVVPGSVKWGPELPLI